MHIYIYIYICQCQTGIKIDILCIIYLVQVPNRLCLKMISHEYWNANY